MSFVPAIRLLNTSSMVSPVVLTGYPADNRQHKVVLSVGGSDSSGGAGIQADIKVFSALGCFAMTAITAITAQNTRGVSGISSVEPGFTQKQIDAVMSDIDVTALKIGMLGKASVIQEVADCLVTHLQKKRIPVVVDPVMFSKTGSQLLEESSISALRDRIIPLATVLTPNIHETSKLLNRSISSKEEMEAAAFDLVKLGAEAVIVKGGASLPNTQSICSDCLVLADKTQAIWLEYPRVRTGNLHGTGCTLSAAIAAFLAHGLPPSTAIQRGKLYVSDCISIGSSYRLGNGCGPVHHFYDVWSRKNFVQKMWLEASPIYEQIKGMPFLLELSNNSLSPQKFGNYINQDLIFLESKIEALNILSTRTEDTQLKKSLEEISTATRLAKEAMRDKYKDFLSSVKSQEPSAGCAEYVTYMKTIVSQGSLLEAWAFLLACTLLYQKVGEHIKTGAVEPNAYAAWVTSYSSQERREKVEKWIEIVNNIAAGSSDVDLRRSVDAFCKGMELEYQFWDSAYNL